MVEITLVEQDTIKELVSEIDEATADVRNALDVLDGLYDRAENVVSRLSEQYPEATEFDGFTFDRPVVTDDELNGAEALAAVFDEDEEDDYNED